MKVVFGCDSNRKVLILEIFTCCAVGTHLELSEIFR